MNLLCSWCGDALEVPDTNVERLAALKVIDLAFSEDPSDARPIGLKKARQMFKCDTCTSKFMNDIGAFPN